MSGVTGPATLVAPVAAAATMQDAGLGADRAMGDRRCNRRNPQRQRLALSNFVGRYGEDFRLGHRGIASLPAFASRCADVLADAAAGARERNRACSAPIAFLGHDGALNGAR